MYTTNMDKTDSNLRQHNVKRSSDYEVQRDPLDDNVYLNVGQAELANMSPDQIEEIS